MGRTWIAASASGPRALAQSAFQALQYNEKHETPHKTKVFEELHNSTNKLT